MSKDILFKDDVKTKLLKGINVNADCVKVTLGPEGKLVTIENQYGTPRFTKDGVSVSKQIVLKDKFENMGVQLVKEVCSKEDNDCGDGTTTTSILTQALCNEGYKSLTSGVSASSINKGISCAVEETIKVINANKKDVESVDDIKNIAMVSSNGDEELSELITQAFEKVGENGIITPEESHEGKLSLTFKEGMQLDKGYVSNYMINTEKGTSELKDAYVLITDETLSNASQIINILNFVALSGKPLFIIADDISGEVLPVLTMNIIQGKLKVNAIKSPWYGEYKTELLDDIATLTGATLISKSRGLAINTVKPEQVLGKVDKVVSDKDSTVIIGGHGSIDLVNERIKSIENSIKTTTEEVPLEKLKERLAKLTGGACILNVYAPTEPELNELKDRVTDTISSVRTSIKDGIVCGGGTMYTLASKTIKPPKTLTDDEKVGFNMVKKALLYPLKTLAENAEMSVDCVIKDTLDNVNGKNGYNIKTKTWDEDLISKVVDPVSVEINALKNASSICKLFLNTSCGIAEHVEEKK